MALEDSSKISTNLNEACILSDILTDKTGNDILSVSTALGVEDFQDARNRTIYAALMNMNKKSIKPDVTTLITELEQTKVLDTAGGLDYISHLVSDYPALGPIENYVNNVKDQALLAKFILSLDKIRAQATDSSIDNIPEFIGQAETEIVAIAKQRRVNQVIDMKSVSSQIVNSLVKQTEDFREHGRKPNGVTGIETGYAALDELTKGWHQGDMIIIGARPSVGKTAFVLNLLYNVAKKGIPVLLFSLEMDALHIGLRLLQKTSSLSGTEINSLDYQRGSTTDQILIKPKNDYETALVEELQRGIDELKNLPFYIDDTPNGLMMDISSKAKKLCNMIKNPGVGLIAIDYLGLITNPSKASSGNRQQEVAEISRQLKQMARELNVPLIALSQLSRESEKRENHEPQLSDLRDSGSIEQDADMIFTLYREDYYQNTKSGKDKEVEPVVEKNDNNPISQVTVNLLKNRNGRIGKLSFSFDKEHSTFSSIDTIHNDDQPDSVFE